MSIINPIKDALVTFLESQKNTLGVKTVAKDLALDNIADDVEKLIGSFPALIVCYYGRQGTRDGTMLDLKHTFAVVVATRSVQGPHKSEPIAADLLDPLLDLLQGRRVAPAVQKTYFDFVSETLQHKDKVMTIYQQLYETDVAINFRAATAG